MIKYLILLVVLLCGCGDVLKEDKNCYSLCKSLEPNGATTDPPFRKSIISNGLAMCVCGLKGNVTVHMLMILN